MEFSSIKDKLMQEFPKFHNENGKPANWHSNESLLAAIEKIAQPGMLTLETGAGYSTVIFALKECKHISITPSREQTELISTYVEQNKGSMQNVEFRIGSSTEILPAIDKKNLDVVFVDGAHRFPFPILDWFYGTNALKQNGYLIIDDVDIVSCYMLVQFMKTDPHWRVVEVNQTYAIFKKVGDLQYSGDWAKQPFSSNKVFNLTDFITIFDRGNEIAGDESGVLQSERNAEVCKRVTDLVQADNPVSIEELEKTGEFLACLLQEPNYTEFAGKNPEFLTPVFFALLAVNIETAYEDGNTALASYFEKIRHDLEPGISGSQPRIFLENKTLIFLHIPKTAGISMRQIIEAQYEPKTIWTVSGSGSGKNAMAILSKMSDDEKRKIRLIQGHNVLCLMNSYEPQHVTLFTMLRNPIERVISHFYYVKRTPEHEDYEIVTSQGMDLKGYFIHSISKEVNNGQTRILAGREFWNYEFGKCPSELLDKAKENLENLCAVVGLTERFDETVRLLHDTFGWTIPIYEKKNVSNNKPKRSELGSETLKLLEKYNRLDIELYHFAEELFEKQLQSIRSGTAQIPTMV